jgi:amidase
VSRSGIIPISHTQDTAGPMARTVADAATLLGVLTGMDPRDEATSASSGHALTDYTRFLDPNGLKGARIGVARDRLMGYNKRVDALIDSALDVMKQAGATIVDPANLETIRTMGAGEGDLLRYEFKHDIDAYLATRGPDFPMKTLADLIAFNDAHAAEEMPYFGQEIFEMSQAMGPLTDKAYLDTLEKTRRLTRDEGIDATIRKYNLDAIVAPTQGPPGLIDLVNGDAGNGGGSASSPAAMAGYPHITVPAGYIYGLPIGISFFGSAWTEPTLIRLAYAFEQHTHARKPPKFLTGAPLVPVHPV